MSEKHQGPPVSREHAAVRLAGIHPAGKEECLALGVTHENLAELCSLVGLLRGAGEWPPLASGDELATANQFGFAAANHPALQSPLFMRALSPRAGRAAAVWCFFFDPSSRSRVLWVLGAATDAVVRRHPSKVLTRMALRAAGVQSLGDNP